MYWKVTIFTGVTFPGKDGTLKFKLTSAPLPANGFTPVIEILSVPGVGLLNDNVRPPPFDVPTLPSVTPVRVMTPGE